MEGVLAFVAIDQDSTWRGRTRPTGRYMSTGWIPGNFLAEGTMLVGAIMRTVRPDEFHFQALEAVAFQVIDHPGGDTARGDYSRSIPGVVRPLLEWTTEFTPNGREPATGTNREES